MRYTTGTIIAALLLVILAAPSAVAQQAADAPAAGDASQTAASQQASDEPSAASMEEFEEAVDAWRETIREMREVMLRFHNGPAETEERYRVQYRELGERGREQFDRVMRIATQLVRNGADTSSPPAQFLRIAVEFRYDHDWYELTGEAAEALLEAGMDGFRLEGIAGVSFVATNRYDRGAEYLQQAVDAGTLESKRFGILDVPETYKERWEREQQFRQQDREKDDLPRVRILTTRGEIIAELFEDQAPNTVANFISLAESGFYDGLLFHQVVPTQVALTGDPTGDGTGNAGYRIPDEHDLENARDAFRGSLAMAKLADPRSSTGQTLPNSASSQFFFTFLPSPWVSREHTVFGRIIEGLPVLSALAHQDPSAEKEEGEPELPPDRVLSVEVIRKRPHEYEPQRIETPLGGVAPASRQAPAP